MTRVQGAWLPEPRPLPAPPGLYIHVPFCLSKCPYCDFYSVSDTSLIPAWLEALEAEARLYQGQFPAFDTLYLGGGTPSLLTPEALAAVMDLVGGYFAFSPNTEITLEANPDDLIRDTLRAYRDLGVNRLSLGIQSLNNRELRFLGRRHTARRAVQALEWAREAGFADLGVDLIYGLPGQTLAAWRRTLERVLDWRPEHLSCYQLTFEPGTEMDRRRAAGYFRTLGEEKERDFFLFTSQFLYDQGYLHYEVSNFARGEAHCSRHNCKYWGHAPYLGLGPAATLALGELEESS